LALGYRRNVVMSAASFLFLPEIVSKSDLVALSPRRLVLGQAGRLTLVDVPWLAEQFNISLIWHERTHAHPGHRWVRDMIVELIDPREPGQS
jgi:DNA-binding transcriptional LysR family regulator